MIKMMSVIVSDPPWSFDDSLSMTTTPRGAEANYATMTNADITALRVKELADPAGCVLALWCPSSLLQTGLDVMKVWGFEQKQTYIWTKTKKVPLVEVMMDVKRLCPILPVVMEIRATLHKTFDGKIAIADIVREAMQSFSMNDVLAFGMGRIFRQTHEVCLIGINKTGIYKRLENKSQRSVSLAEKLGHSTKP